MTKISPATGARTIKRLTFLALLAAIAITLAMVRVLQPTTIEADILFSGWLLLPYVLLAALAAIWSRDCAAALANLAATLLVAGGGLIFLADVIFFHPDAQGPIALLLAPLLQGIAIGIVLPLSHWILRRIAKRRITPNEH